MHREPPHPPHAGGPPSPRVRAEEATGTARRARWAAPRVLDYGSLRWFVRAATGPHGDKGTSVGKRL